jgi:large subunit ribosomal protein L13
MPVGLIRQKTTLAKPGQVEQKWYLIDATGKVVGRLAAAIARILMGKHKPAYTPHVDVGDFVVVVNCEKVRFTGRKMSQKEYKRYTGYPGGLKIESAEKMLAKKPEEILRQAVKRMLPKNRLARRQLEKLKLYRGPKHPHAAQQPVPLELEL